MIKEILLKIMEGQYEFTRHAVDQSLIRHISVQEIREAVAKGKIIKDYLKQVRAKLPDFRFYRSQ
jgi:hypothetical protein